MLVLHIYEKGRFWCNSGPLAFTHIIKSKAEPATIRIKRLLEVLNSYLFNWYYIKGKDMILNNFLSRQKYDDSNPHEIIQISLNMQGMLQARYYNIGEEIQKSMKFRNGLKQHLVG